MAEATSRKRTKKAEEPSPASAEMEVAAEGPSNSSSKMLTRTQSMSIDTGKFFFKSSNFLVILTTFEFSRLKVDTKLLENGTFENIANLK